MSDYILPILLGFLFIYCLLKKIPAFDLFVEGGKSAIPLIFSIFPYVLGIFFMIELAKASGALALLVSALTPIYSLLGIPEGVITLTIFRPFSGSGSLAILEEIFARYGVDSFEGKLASVICGAGETVFYLVAVYFSSCGIKKIGKAVPIALFCSFVGVIVACVVLRI